MRIISNFHDFYDGVQAHRQDERLVYVRQRQGLDEAERRAYPEPQQTASESGWRGRRCSVYARPFWLAVAGKIYRGYRLRKRFDKSVDVAEEVFVYDIGALSSHAVSFGVADPEAPTRLGRRRRWLRRDDSRALWLAGQDAEELRDALIAKEVVTAGAFLGWSRKPKKLIINPRLADFEFWKIMDPFQIFQELSMWVGGVLPQKGAMMATVPDAIRYVEHGFDAKTSFRRGRA